MIGQYLTVAALLLHAAFLATATAKTYNSSSDNLTVRTRTGTFVGSLDDAYTDVRQFRYVPYAKVTRSFLTLRLADKHTP